MAEDITGSPITVASDAALRAWNETVEAVLAHAATTPAALSRAIAAEPGFALAHAARGLMLMTLARAELLAPAREALTLARAAALLRPIDTRESSFIEALALWIEGAPRRAAAALEAVLERHPRDALALKFAHAIRFVLGDGAGMLAVLERVAPAYDATHRLGGYVLGCHAFALEEAGRYAEAESVGRRAVARAPRDVWGRHAVAHVFEMTGRVDEGIDWLSDARGWAHANNFALHVFWHVALFRMARGDIAEVLRLYDEEIRAARTDDFRDLANGASLLARLEFEGVDVGDRWEELAEIAERRINDRCLVFADLHYILALLGAGKRDGAEALAQGLSRDAHAREGSEERRLAARAGAPAAFGLMAFREGDYAEAARLFTLARPALGAIGGSHAQRDLFTQAHAESLIRSGAFDEATRLLEERLAARGPADDFASKRLAAIAGRTTPGRLACSAIAAVPSAATH